MTAAQRARLLSATRATATNQCIARALEGLGYDGSAIVRRRSTGNRDWPAGVVGSVTHKGAVVLVALAPKALYDGIGIDVERHVSGELAPILDDIGLTDMPSQLPPDLAASIAFSAKEAAFKAQFPLTEKILGFRDVELDWEAVSVSHSRMVSRLTGLNLSIGVSIVGAKWVVSAAQIVARSRLDKP